MTEQFQDILAKRLHRRTLLAAGVASGAAALLSACGEKTSIAGKTSKQSTAAPSSKPSSLSFKELAQGLDENFAVAEGYNSQTVIAWGDPLFKGAPAFDPYAQSETAQSLQFGYNNDYIGYLELPSLDAQARGLLVVNHEYSSPELMYPGSPSSNSLNLDQCKLDIVAHGLSVVEIRQDPSAQWQVALDSKFNRRITPWTDMQISGPAAGHPRMKTLISRDGIHTLGTYGNCAGGVTPWGTVLTGEENVDGYFYGDAPHAVEEKNFASFNVETNKKNWGQHFPRWNLQDNPRELLHMGWIVEVDPFDPNSKPKKRSALGRFKHEGANVFINRDGRVATYMGDDEGFQFIYKFLSKGQYRENDRQANRDLLDEGDLYVAKFHDDGRLQWLPLQYGEAPLTEENGFSSQGDVVIDVRIAAKLLGATPMDRPEDVDINPHNGHVYAMLTNNSGRREDQRDAANPRAFNRDGQIVEFWPENGDHSDDSFSWDIFIIAGKLTDPATTYPEGTTENGWFSCPDNCTFDKLGNIWISTDGALRHGIADGVWAAEVEGDGRARSKRFIRTPVGAEMCGPSFTADNETFFCAVQHPAAGSSFENPSTRWPDFDEKLPPRPAVVAVTKVGGGRVGS